MIELFEKKDLTGILKLLPTFLIFLGVLKLITFYYCFNIRIVEYLDLSEVLISFTDSFVFYLCIFILPISLVLSFWGKSIGTFNNELFNEQKNKNFAERILSDIKENKYVIIICSILTFVITIFGKWQFELLGMFLIYPGLNIISILVREIRISLINQYDYKIPVTYINLFFLLTMITTFMIFWTLDEASNIKRRNIYKGTEIYLENEIIKSDDFVTYIGQTKNYIFLYNLKENKSISIPRDRVKKFVLKAE